VSADLRPRRRGREGLPLLQAGSGAPAFAAAAEALRAATSKRGEQTGCKALSGKPVNHPRERMTRMANSEAIGVRLRKI
jgi:hypothetical protein